MEERRPVQNGERKTERRKGTGRDERIWRGSSLEKGRRGAGAGSGARAWGLGPGSGGVEGGREARGPRQRGWGRGRGLGGGRGLGLPRGGREGRGLGPRRRILHPPRGGCAGGGAPAAVADRRTDRPTVERAQTDGGPRRGHCEPEPVKADDAQSASRIF